MRSVGSLPAGDTVHAPSSSDVSTAARKLVFVTVVLLAMGSLFGLSLLLRPAGVTVLVTNEADDVMRSVVVEVTGTRVPIGDISGGSTASVRVLARGESSVVVELLDEMSIVKRLDADCYFEPGYRGELQLSIRDGQIVSMRDEIELGAL